MTRSRSELELYDEVAALLVGADSIEVVSVALSILVAAWIAAAKPGLDHREGILLAVAQEWDMLTALTSE